MAGGVEQNISITAENSAGQRWLREPQEKKGLQAAAVPSFQLRLVTGKLTLISAQGLLAACALFLSTVSPPTSRWVPAPQPAHHHSSPGVFVTQGCCDK